MALAIPKNGEAVTPHDTNYLSQPGTLYIGTSGDICVLLDKMADSNDPADGLIFKNAFGDFPRLVRKVFATNTTASDIILDKDN